MKNWKYLIVLALFAVLLAACSSGSEEGVDAVVQPTEAVDTAAPTVAPVPTDTPLPPPPSVVEVESAPTEGSAQPAEKTVWPAGQYGYGVQIHGDATYGSPDYVASVVKNELGMDWVKMQIKWSAVRNEGPDSDQWFIYDGTIDEVSKAGLYLMVSVVSAPEWTRAAGGENGPPDDLNLYVDFINQLLARHGEQIDAIEVWNEQNLDREWSTAEGINPARYVEMLRMTYEAIKAYNPDIIVISGALSPTGFNDRVTAIDDFVYLDEALAAGMLDYADCVGVHHNGYNIPPNIGFDETGALPEASTAQFRGPFDNPHHSWSFKTTLDTYAAKAQAIDPNMQLCITEFGWASSEGYDAIPETFEFAWDNTLEEQAQYIVQAYQQMRESGYVWLTFLFNYDFGNKGWGIQDDTVPYSLVSHPDGIPRLSFAAVANMEKIR
ncbi:MAG: hypothetical protein KDE09_05245 [Anaerolineales bacterium]|nr:hypothetical protein [Anaerolineales bacterium]MCB0009014.1 hypothetical protein [Anaerolineales bacterium]MCB0011386.1 hypothetical protein [Anaerolineales bacterium]MCB0017175.1 hypothetical protein [Anaerolineales bacterium]MCB8962922.1 hypothetical protein [Ardenticatenales bacterium]